MDQIPCEAYTAYAEGKEGAESEGDAEDDLYDGIAGTLDAH